MKDLLAKIDRHQRQIFSAIIVYGIAIRMMYFFISEPQAVDLKQYMQSARYLLGKETNYGAPREIGYPIILAITGIFFEINLLHARILTMIFSVVNLFVMRKFSKVMMIHWEVSKEFETLLSLFSVFLLANSPSTIIADNYGVREPIVTFILLIFLILVFGDYSSAWYKFGIFATFFYLGITRSEFQILGFGIAVVFFFEGLQFDSKLLQLKGIITAISSIVSLTFWKIFSLLMFGNSSATTNMYVWNVTYVTDPAIAQANDTLTLSWFIFDYKGLPSFIILVLRGTEGIIHNLPFFLGNVVFYMVVIGTLYTLKISRISFHLVILGSFILNSFNAYLFDYNGTSRIISSLYPILFVIATTSLLKLDNFDLTYFRDRKFQLKGSIILVLLVLLILIEGFVKILV